jgi:hypothetical protein
MTRSYIPGNANLSVTGLFRRFELTEEDRFPWTLQRWNRDDPRATQVLAVRMVPNGWRQEVDVTFECHVIRKDGTPGVKGIDHHLDTSDLTQPEVPAWVREEQANLRAFHAQVIEAVATVTGDPADD